jgi:hypothetical protein
MTMFSRLSICTALALIAGRHAAAQPAPTPQPPVDPARDQRPTPPVPDPAAPSQDAGAPAQDPGPPGEPPASPPPAVAPKRPVAPGTAAPQKKEGVTLRDASSLRRLRDQGRMTENEYQRALQDLREMSGTRSADALTLVVSGLYLTLFGHVQTDVKWDSTQSCLDFCGSLPIQKAGTLRGDHGRLIFSPRGSRLGLRFAAPPQYGIYTTGLLEADLFGSTDPTEQGVWSSPVLRLREAWVRLETPIVDILIGQTANLFGWSAKYLVTGVQQPGLPGQMYQRTPQLRLSRTFPLRRRFTADVAFAAQRPPQQDAAAPEMAFGARLSLVGWTGYHTSHLAGSVVQPASIAVTGDTRRFAIAEFSTAPREARIRWGGGIAVNAFLPIIPATETSRDNALSISGELVVGSGTSDMYNGLGSAGTVNAAIPPAMPGELAGTYTPNFDPGLAAFDVLGNLELIRWTSYLVGAELYPAGVGGRVGLWANYGHMESSNSYRFGGPDAVVNDPALGRTREKEDFVDLGVFVDPMASLRVGAGLAYFRDRYVDATIATSYSVMTSAWLSF